jgi:hypothetical protein
MTSVFMDAAMAYLIISRLCLLLLLGCDYVWDPYLGTNPLSRELASTETYCQSLNDSAAAIDSVCVEHECLHQPGAWAQQERPFLCGTHQLGLTGAGAVRDLLYLYMSAQC